MSKFATVSIFSDLNNLTDLTMHPQAATLPGYTQEELKRNCVEHIEALAATLDLTVARTMDKLRRWYNGYRFHHEGPSVYNPLSVMKCFAFGEMKSDWFETGTDPFVL